MGARDLERLGQLTQQLYQAGGPELWDPDFYRDDGPMAHAPGHRGWCAAVAATKDRTDNQSQRLDRPWGDLPKWPSTLARVDDHFGGFFGVTALVAPPGVGKTMLAFSSALQAAATQEWNVRYFGAELDEGEMAARYARELECYENAAGGSDFLQVVQVGRGQYPQDFCADLADVDRELPILVVLDSINTIATLAGRDYLRTIEEFAMWAMFARRLSRGAISFLIVSESNKKGNSKGEKLEFWSDLAITLKGERGKPDVDFSITKCRGDWINLGVLHRDWKTNRFYSLDQLTELERRRHPRLRLVGDDVEF